MKNSSNDMVTGIDSQLEDELASYSTTAKTRLSRKRNVKRACVAFGAAASAGLVAGTAIEAGIVYVNIPDIVLGASATVFIDIDGGGADFGFQNGTGNTAVGFGLNSGDGLVNGYGAAVLRYGANNLIGTPGSSFPGGSGLNTTAFLSTVVFRQI